MTVDAIPLAVGQTTKFSQYFVKPSKENEKNTLQKQNKRVKKKKVPTNRMQVKLKFDSKQFVLWVFRLGVYPYQQR